jgi:hypothetical protein
MYNDKNYNQNYREFLEGLRSSYNNTADNVLQSVQTIKQFAQANQPYNTFLINYWQNVESEIVKFRTLVNTYYDLRVADYS